MPKKGLIGTALHLETPVSDLKYVMGQATTMSGIWVTNSNLS